MASRKKPVKKTPKKKPPKLFIYRATVRVAATCLEGAVELVKDGKWAEILEVVEEK